MEIYFNDYIDDIEFRQKNEMRHGFSLHFFSKVLKNSHFSSYFITFGHKFLSLSALVKRIMWEEKWKEIDFL